jgi:hypothetical protein
LAEWFCEELLDPARVRCLLLVRVEALCQQIGDTVHGLELQREYPMLEMLGP